ncbi:gamma-glutamylcyclotransferase, partial [Francisella tularensis subsp. holarctica]|nr:gamma-glutamylcyclotransferase [Francisella tularensis subsp. holarctica]
NKAESIHESELRILEQSKLSQSPEDSLNCRPEVNPNKDNSVIGYGSLMNKDSRQITVPNATYAAPILVSSFERLWASRGEKS